MFQAPAHLTKAHHLFDCISFTVYRFPYCHTVLNADGRVHTVTYLRLFLSFSSHKFLHLFTFAHPFFSPSSGSFLFFYFSSQFSFIPIFFMSISVFTPLNLCATQASYNSYTSLLPHSSCYHAYYVLFGTVSS